MRTAEYYRDVLGFEIAGYWATPPAFMIVKRDLVELFFHRADPRPDRRQRTEGAYDAYLQVVGVEAPAAELRKRGAEILEGPVIRVYGQRELVVRYRNALVPAFGANARWRQR